MASKYKNWKKGDIIICIQNAGYREQLTINKEYVVVDYHIRYGIEHVMITSNEKCIIDIFANRFLALKDYNNKIRKEKLEKIRHYV